MTSPTTIIDFSKKTQENDEVADGVYRVKLVNISEPKMFKGYQGIGEAEKWIFRFEITRDLNLEADGDEDQVDHTGRELSMFVPTASRGPKSWLWKITSALTGQDPATLGQFDLYSMTYLECKVTVKQKVSADGEKTYCNIVDLMPIKKGNATAANSKKAPVESTARPVPEKLPAKTKVELEELSFEDD